MGWRSNRSNLFPVSNWLIEPDSIGIELVSDQGGGKLMDDEIG
jgi:hypothetical protein